MTPSAWLRRLPVVITCTVVMVAGCEAVADDEPIIISTLDIAADTVIVPAEAVGMCAINRKTGLLEGQVVRVLDSTGGDETRYEVESLENPARSTHMRASAVHLDLCERAAGGEPGAEPLRRSGG
jgi:hypothetical protein